MKNSFASLSPTLLARKGGAKPAMRPQVQPLRPYHDNAALQLSDDLGWNDMGHDAPAEPEPAPPVVHEAEIVPLLRSEPIVAEVPEVVRQQKAIVTRLDTVRRSALADGRRAAFTLRLDGERHVKLRLACVARNRSAQQLVTEALDRLIAEMPELAELAGQLRKRR